MHSYFSKLIFLNAMTFIVTSCALPEENFKPDPSTMTVAEEPLVAAAVKPPPVVKEKAYPAVPENTKTAEFAVFDDWMVIKVKPNLNSNYAVLCQIYDDFGVSTQWRAAEDIATREHRPPERGKKVCWSFYSQNGTGVVDAEGVQGGFPRCAHKFGAYKVRGLEKREMSAINVGACRTTVMDARMAEDFTQGAVVDIQIGYGEHTLSLAGFERAYRWAMDHEFDYKSSDQVLKEARERKKQ